MSSQRTSLLAQDHNDPALSGPPPSAMEGTSALSRLIAESTPPMPFSSLALDETETAATVHKKSSFTTILAGTLITLQWGFLWGAYFSKSWMDAHLQVYIGWQEQFLPWLDKHTDLTLLGMSVFTLSDNLRDDKEYGSLAGIWFCSIVLPCVFMIVCPIWILTDFNAPPRPRSLPLFPYGRTWLELTIRLSWLVAFIILGLDVAIAGIELQWEDTDIQVHNRLLGPYVAYLVGCTFALLCVVILRMPYMEHLKLLGYPHQPTNPVPAMATVSTHTPPPPQARHAPPANAFSLPWLNSADNSNDAQQPLLDQGRPPFTGPTTVTIIKPWQNVVLFQVGLLALVLWIPALALEQFRVLYAGIIMDMVQVPAFNVYVWELPVLVWQSSRRAGTPLWILLTVLIIMGVFVVVLPLVAHGVAVMTWRNGGRGNKWRDALQLLQPTLCGIPFALALIVTVPSFEDIGENIDQSICVQVEKVVQNQCLISGGVVLWGAYFLFAQAVCLELFIYLVLCWTAPPKPNPNTV